MEGPSCDSCRLLIAEVEKLREEQKSGQILLAKILQDIQEFQEYTMQYESSQSQNESIFLISSSELISDTGDSDDQIDNSAQQEQPPLSPTSENIVTSSISLEAKQVTKKPKIVPRKLPVRTARSTESVPTREKRSSKRLEDSSDFELESSSDSELKSSSASTSKEKEDSDWDEESSTSKEKVTSNSLFSKLIGNVPYTDSSEVEKKSKYELVSSSSTSHVVLAKPPNSPKNKRGQKRKGNVIDLPSKSAKILPTESQSQQEGRILRPRNPKGPAALNTLLNTSRPGLPVKEFSSSQSLVVKESCNPTQNKLDSTNKLWMQVASELKTFWNKEFEFIFDSKSNEYKTEYGSLQSLVDFLEQNNNNNNFPVSEFKFSGGHMLSPDVDKFFSSHGNAVKSLCLNLDKDIKTDNIPKVLASFRKILLNVRPTLECLELYRLPFDTEEHHETMKLFPDSKGTIQFPKLKKIVVPSHVKIPAGFYFDLLNASVNLEITKWFHMSRVEDLLVTNKIHTVREIDFLSSGIDEHVESFRQLAKSKQLKLNVLDFCGVPNQEGISEAINNIFMSSRDTLKEIHWLNRLAPLTNLKIQIMKKMKQLWIWMDHPPQDFLPAGCPILSQIFPNLVQFVLSCDQPLSEKDTTILSQKVGVLKSVDVFHAFDGFTFTMAKILSHSFPNVRTLYFEISNLDELPKILRMIWAQYKCIKTVGLKTTVTENKNICSEMDSSITGMDEVTCTRLRKNSRKVSLEKAKKLRTLPSIFDAKSLEIFELTFHFNDNVKEMPTIMSDVSEKYGFQPIRDERAVKVTIEIDEGFENTVVGVKPCVDSVTIKRK